MKLVVFTAGFYDRDYDQKLEKLKKSCLRFDIDLKVYGKGVFFSFYKSKVELLGNFLNTQKKEYTHALFTDAADTFFLSGLEEIIEKYQRFQTPLLLSSEKYCYPYGELSENFPQSPTAYRYFNAGGFIGEIPYILDTLSKLKKFHYLNNNDNAHWMLAYNEKRIELAMDYHCEIFQTMSDTPFGKEIIVNNKRIENVITNTKPCIIHFNGPKGPGTVNDEISDKIFQECIL